MYMREVNEYQKLYSLDVLGIEDREGMINWMFCVTLRRVLCESKMEGMRLVLLGYRERH